MRRLTIFVLFALAASTLSIARGDSHYTKITDVRVAMDDGARLAVDVYVPTIADGDDDGLYPCVVELTPYRKESRASEGAGFLPAQGIALIEVDARGTGGSEGEYDIVFSVREQADAAAMVGWAATTATKPDGSPLCEQTVGMYGGSYSGIIQYLVASLPEEADGDVPAAPPHLAAIAPQRAYGDLYRDIVYHGGMVIASFGTIWSAGTTAYYTQPPADIDTADGQAAWRDHLTKNDPLIAYYLERPFVDATYTSDDTDPSYTQRLYEDSSILSRIDNLKVPTLHLAGWYDAFTRGQLRTFSEAYALEQQHGDRGPNHLIVGPWNHSGTHFISPDQGFRQDLADWYLYWLEGAEAEADAPPWIAGPRVRFFQTTSGVINGDEPTDGVWATSDRWPPENLGVEHFALGSDGLIRACEPTCAPSTGSRAYVSNPSAGTGEILSRWDNAAGTPHPQWDQRTETGKGLTWTTAPLGRALSITGPIGLTLRAAITGLDGGGSHPEGLEGWGQLTPPYLDTDFVVKVSDVAPDGTATLVTQGYLRASHRAYDPSRSIYVDGELMGPYHLHTADALDPPASGVARDYELEIWPIAKTFAPGHSLRIDLTSSDTPNHLTILTPTLNEIVADPVLRLPVAS